MVIDKTSRELDQHDTASTNSKLRPARLSITLFGEKPSESSGAPQVKDQGILDVKPWGRRPRNGGK